MTESVAGYVKVMDRKRDVGLELDELLDKRRGLCEVSRSMTERVTDAEREAILAEYVRRVADLDSHCARLRWKIQTLDHELDQLAGVKRG